MGNRLGSVVDRRCTTIMEVSGETLKIRTPVQAADILKVQPGYVLLEAEEVKKFGTRAKPLGFHEQLEAKKLYFLVDYPTTLEKRPVMKRLSAEGKLEKLMVARKVASVSPLPSPQGGGGVGVRRVTVRLSKEEYKKLMKDSKDGAEVAKKIMEISTSLNDHKDQNFGGVKISEDTAVEPNRTQRERRVRFLDASVAKDEMATIINQDVR